MPVGRENERNPLGHSGQRRLHDVVGSIAMAEGRALRTGLRNKRETQYPIIKRNPFQSLDGVSDFR